MTFGDKIVIIGMLILSLLFMFIINVFFYGDTGTSVLIEVDGKLYAKYNFNEINSSKYVEIRTKYGYNKVEIAKDKVRVVEADCPDKLDVSAGWISRANQMIVCLPNRVVIKIVDEYQQIDGVSY